MIDCLILGDQIAADLAAHLSGCISFAKPGITSREFNNSYNGTHLIYNNEWDTVIISLGMSDDPTGKKTKDALKELRHGIRAKHVMWILPPENQWDLRTAVHDVAMGRQDGLLEVTGWSRNAPTVYGYREMANKVKSADVLR